MAIPASLLSQGQNLLGLGRKVIGPSGSMQRKLVAGGALGAIGLKGMADVVLPGARDAALDLAFDDPNADEKILGTKLSPSMLVGGALPGQANAGVVAGSTIAGAGSGAYLGRKFGAAGMVVGGLAGAMTGGYGSALATGGAGAMARGMNPTRFGSIDGSTVGTAAQTTFIGSGVGSIAGAAYGFKKRGIKGAIAGSAVGGIVGAIPGAIGVGGSASFAYQSARDNSQILSESPFYNSSLMTADRLNASGDIVLGAHNTRRGR
jgi:hypothetical protein